MAEVSIEIAGREYPVHCKDGGEDRLRMIAEIVDAKARDAQRAVGGMNETRHILLAALLLADELHEARKSGGAVPAAAAPESAPSPSEPLPGLVPLLEKLADRVESLAERLETERPSA